VLGIPDDAAILLGVEEVLTRIARRRGGLA
jgi:hypothetical protein